MLIGFDGSRAFSSNKTGTENYSYQLLKALLKIDKADQYIVYVRQKTLTWTAVQHNVFFREISWPRLWTQGGLAVQTFKDKLDVLFVPSHTLPIIRKPGLKTVVTVHDLGSEYLPLMHQLKQRLYLSLMQKYQLKTASHIIAVSKATKMDLINKIGIGSRKITVVYEGYDKEKFQAPSSKLQVPSSKFLFVGTVQPRKNLERVIAAFSSHLEGVRAHLRGGLALVIVGSKGWLSDEIYALPKKLGIEDRVKFLGYVSDRELPALYKGAIALVFPSLFEGFGLPILEAQACGCPVITSNISSMPEVVGKGAILVDPYDIEAIVSAMIRVEGKGVREKLIKEGLENAKRFSWEKCARETLEVLEETVKKG